MLYADFSMKRMSGFLGMASVMTLALVATISATKYLPREYSSGKEAAHSLSLAFQSNRYKQKFAPNSSDSSSQPGLLASVVSAFSFKKPVATISVSGSAQAVPVLVYHGITKKVDRFSMTADTFAGQMFALKQAGYQTITVEQFDQFMRGEITLPNKSFLLTFDDGRRDSFEGADPVLKAAGFHAVMFVATGDSLRDNVGTRSYYLDTNGVQRMLDTGRWEIGSHAIQENTKGGLIPVDSNGTLGNFLSNKMWLWNESRLETDAEYATRVMRELTKSKTDLTSTFNVTPIALSYPFSDYGEQSVNNPRASTTINAATRDNYVLALEQVDFRNDTPSEFVANIPGDDMFHLRRLEVPTNWTGDHLLAVLDNVLPKPLPYHDDFTADAGWRGTWGSRQIETGSGMTLAATASTTGSFTVLDGTQLWTNYMYTVDTTWEGGSHVSLIGRFVDPNNYASCVFSNDGVRIEEKVNGVVRVLRHVDNTVDIPTPNVSFGMLVDGAFIRCYEGSRVATFAYDLSPSLDAGAIGMQVWDPATDTARLRVRSLSAVAAGDAEDLKAALPDYNLR